MKVGGVSNTCALLDRVDTTNFNGETLSVIVDVLQTKARQAFGCRLVSVRMSWRSHRGGGDLRKFASKHVGKRTYESWSGLL